MVSRRTLSLKLAILGCEPLVTLVSNVVAVGTADIALLYFSHNPFDAARSMNHIRNVIDLGAANVIEMEGKWVAKTAIDAWMSK